VSNPLAQAGIESQERGLTGHTVKEFGQVRVREPAGRMSEYCTVLSATDMCYLHVFGQPRCPAYATQKGRGGRNCAKKRKTRAMTGSGKLV
jgi:hypothetical protein